MESMPVVPIQLRLSKQDRKMKRKPTWLHFADINLLLWLCIGVFGPALHSKYKTTDRLKYE